MPADFKNSHRAFCGTFEDSHALREALLPLLFPAGAASKTPQETQRAHVSEWLSLAKAYFQSVADSEAAHRHFEQASRPATRRVRAAKMEARRAATERHFAAFVRFCEAHQIPSDFRPTITTEN